MLLNPLQLPAFSHGSLLTCCLGISDGASQAPGGCVRCLPWGHELVRGNWAAVVAACENRKPPRCFFPPYLFSLPSPFWCGEFGKEDLHPEMWRVCESSHGEAGHRASCWSWLHRGTAAHWWSLGSKQQGSWHRVQRGNLSSFICVVWDSFTYLLLGNIATTWLAAKWPSAD